MSRKNITSKQKLKAVHEYLKGNTSFVKLGRKYGVNESSIRSWIAKYKALGDNVFKINCCNLNYSAEFKNKVVKDYLIGEGSYQDIAIKYKIHAASTVIKWVLQYNNHEILTNSRPKGVFSMVNGNGRKTTYEDRIDIVRHCIERQNNYAEVALKFKVSYQQVNSWWHKYNKGGVEALIDRRGRTKPANELNEFEKLKIENKLLQAQICRVQIENDFLKKLKEMERRRS